MTTGPGEHAATPHGFELPPDDQRLLRSLPPPEALAWVAGAVGAGARVTAVRAMEGGTSSAVHCVDVVDRSGRRYALVLRRYVRADWLADEPDVPVREASTLQVLRGSPVAAPELVGVDPDGGASGGTPALAMTRLDGRLDWSPADLDPYLERLACVLPRIHAVPLPGRCPLPAYRPYALRMHRQPRWALRPRVWEQAIEVLDGSPPGRAGGVLIHRDYHPGNVLWRKGMVTGVVDWANASVGMPEADVGHCRANLYGRFGSEAADRFLTMYHACSGRRDYHPYWDIAAAIGGMGRSLDDRPNLADEAFLEAAVRRLGA